MTGFHQHHRWLTWPHHKSRAPLQRPQGPRPSQQRLPNPCLGFSIPGRIAMDTIKLMADSLETPTTGNVVMKNRLLGGIRLKAKPPAPTFPCYRTPHPYITSVPTPPSPPRNEGQTSHCSQPVDTQLSPSPHSFPALLGLLEMADPWSGAARKIPGCSPACVPPPTFNNPVKLNPGWINLFPQTNGRLFRRHIGTFRVCVHFY